ncbi:hypothetical protein [Streptomyces sp. NPDC091217]|uniref:hypothetical protein n=1 Tax=Streptomyces sp. NPDC091217 TaxID=3365975 RepID=UPI0037F6AB5F
MTETETAGDHQYGPGWEQRGRQALADAARSIGAVSSDPPVPAVSESTVSDPGRVD